MEEQAVSATEGRAEAMDVETTSSTTKDLLARPVRKSFAPYIYKVLKQVHPDTTISHKALAIMDRYKTILVTSG